MTGGKSEPWGKPLLGKGSLAQGAAPPAVIEFDQVSYAFSEGSKWAELSVHRTGVEDTRVQVDYHTVEGTAESGKDFESASGTLVFEKGVTITTISVRLIDDDEHEEDEIFHVHLSLPEPAETCELGAKRSAEVKIIDDDSVGMLMFEEDEFEVIESQGKVIVAVQRRGGTKGDLSCGWHTCALEGSSLKTNHYNQLSGELHFADGGALQQSIEIPILDTKAYELHEEFAVMLQSRASSAALSLDQQLRSTRSSRSASAMPRHRASIFIKADPRRKQPDRRARCDARTARSGWYSSCIDLME